MIHVPSDIRKLKRRSASQAMPVLPNRAAELALRKEILGSLDGAFVSEKTLKKWMSGKISPAEARETLQKLTDEWRKSYSPRADSVARRFIERLSEASRERFAKSVKSALGVSRADIFDSASIHAAAEVASLEAAALIRSVPEDYMSQASEAVMANFRQEALPEGRTLSEHLQYLLDISKTRAATIARDQTSKVNTGLTVARATEIGVEEYTWETSRDLRVVGNPSGPYPKGNAAHMNHYERHGKVFRLDSPPPDGHPGWAINCRCVMRLIIRPERLVMA